MLRGQWLLGCTSQITLTPPTKTENHNPFSTSASEDSGMKANYPYISESLLDKHHSGNTILSFVPSVLRSSTALIMTFKNWVFSCFYLTRYVWGGTLLSNQSNLYTFSLCHPAMRIDSYTFSTTYTDPCHLESACSPHLPAQRVCHPSCHQSSLLRQSSPA